MVNISCVFAGDIMAHGNQLRAARNAEGDGYDFSPAFKNIKKYTEKADIAVCNLETTISGGEVSGYPRFNSPEELVRDISEAGFNCVAAANNHSFDTGMKGIKGTRKCIEKYGMTPLGIRSEKNGKAYALVEAGGIKLGIINFTYETARRNGKHSLNNHPMDEQSAALINSYSYESVENDLKKIRAEMEELRAEGAKLIIAFFHWGNEYERHSNVFQKFMAWSAAKMGADAVIGSHAHVMQEISSINIESEGKVKTVPVFYGLGNFIWGAEPMFERETVLNNIMARLEIEYDGEKGEVKITPSYIPLFISQSKNRFENLDLNSLSPEEQQSFSEKHKYSYAETMEQIRQTAENEIHSAPVRMYFEKILELKAGQRFNLKEFLPRDEYKSYRSEDAIIASVTQNGYVIANRSGYVGLTAVNTEGEETVFICRVKAGEAGKFPVLVDEFNSIRDIYLPPNRVSGEAYMLPENESLCAPAALAWKKMLMAARDEGVYLNCSGTFRTKKQQLIRRKKYAEIYGAEACSRRYQRPGCSEHNLGTALDVNGGEYQGSRTLKADAIRWTAKNAGKFGFAARKFTASMAKTAYIHLNYVEDPEFAQFLNLRKLSIADYLSDYEKYGAEFEKDIAWRKITVPADDESPRLSLRKMCRIADMKLPEELLPAADRLVPQIILSDEVPVQKGSVFFYDKNLSKEMQKCRNAMRSGSVCAVAESQIYDEAGMKIPTIIVKNSLDACVKVGKYIRDKYPAKTICITGSAGKSTSTELCYHVLSSKFNTHTCTNYNNANSRVWILELMQRLKPEHEMYVQEVGGSFIEHIEKGTRMLQPDVAIITNIAEAHLDLYKNFENIKRDKLSLLENRRPGGLGLLNIDNCHLAERVKQSKEGILTYSMEDPEADYYADNVVQTAEALELTVVEKSSGRRTDIKLKIAGRHNAYNILCAFATGRWAGMTEEEIIAGLAAYKARDIRQRLETVGGYNLYVDCFSMTDISVVFTTRTLSEMVTQKGAKKIAVLFPLVRLGDEEERIMRSTAEKIRDYQVDHIIAFGKESEMFAEELNKGPADIIYTDDWYELVSKLKQICRPGDVILFKGSYIQPIGLAIDAAFGTDFMFNRKYTRAHYGKTSIHEGLSCMNFYDLACVIEQSSLKSGTVEIPDSIDGKPVISINKGAFENSEISGLKLGENVVSILDSAFENCRKLETVKLNKQLRTIGDGAFTNCTELKSLILPRSLGHIGERAFAGCSSLEEIYIHSNVKEIGENAFEGCEKLKIITLPGSYAETYAQKAGIILNEK